MKNSYLSLFFILLTIQTFFSGCASMSSRQYEVNQVVFQANSPAEFKVEVATYRNQIASKKSLILMPPSGGENYIDRSYARQFAKAGYDVYIIKHWTNDDEKSSDLELHQRLYERSQRAIAIVLDKIQSPFIGMLGTSVGATYTAVAANSQDRINAIFIIVGGAPITEIIVNSDQTEMKDLKKMRVARFGFNSDEEYKSALEKAFHLEPMLTGNKYKKKDLGMVVAEEDTTVPTNTQQKLEDFWKPRTVIHISRGHFWGIIKTWWSEKEAVLSFFESSPKR